jgi:hypothetical protein
MCCCILSPVVQSYFISPLRGVLPGNEGRISSDVMTGPVKAMIGGLSQQNAKKYLTWIILSRMMAEICLALYLRCHYRRYSVNSLFPHDVTCIVLCSRRNRSRMGTLLGYHAANRPKQLRVIKELNRNIKCVCTKHSPQIQCMSALCTAIRRALIKWRSKMRHWSICNMLPRLVHARRAETGATLRLCCELVGVPGFYLFEHLLLV